MNEDMPFGCQKSWIVSGYEELMSKVNRWLLNGCRNVEVERQDLTPFPTGTAWERRCTRWKSVPASGGEG